MSTLRTYLYAAFVLPMFSMAAVGCLSDSGDQSDDANDHDPIVDMEEAEEAEPVDHNAKLRIPANAFELIPNRYIVRMVDSAGKVDGQQKPLGPDARRIHAENLVTKVGLSGAAVVHVYESVLNGFVAELSEEEALRLAEDRDVLYVEQDQVMRASNVTWGLDRIDQRDLPLNSAYSPTYGNGAGVHAYIVDTGIRTTHTEFTGRVGNGRDTVSSDDDPSDCNGHGTHVGGTVAGTVYGVAPGAIVHGVRVLDCNGSGTNSGVIAGVDWVRLNHIKPAVGNMSLGGGASQALDDAVTAAINAGVPFAVAAGNENQNACNVSPARTPAAITVGSSTSTDARSSFSNFGTCVDLFAPGSNITAAWHTSNTATNTISGTSMASPHVAGVAARYLSSNPNATAQQVRDALVASASPSKLSGVGTGSPNLLLYVGGGSNEPPPPPPPLPPPAGVLANGTPVSNLSGSTGTWVHYTMTVPAGASNLQFQMSGGTGDGDLYVQFGSQPTDTSYACRPYLGGNSETCTFAAPQAGTYHVSIKAFSSYSGVTLVGSYSTSGGFPGNELSESNLSASTGGWVNRTLSVPSGASKVTFTISGGTGDSDLYVRFGSAPTTTTYNCRPYLSGNNEVCTFQPPQVGTYHIGLQAFSTFSGVSLVGNIE